MPDNNTIGEAYIQIKPSMEGVSSEIEKAMGDAGASGSSSFGSKFAAGLKTIGVAASAAVGTAVAGVTSLTKSAVSSFADYEQLVGGLETMFEDLSFDVEENANRAFQTAGLSANEYMETVMGFSASLNQSLLANEGNIARAADLSDQIIIDMADNANKMGTSMESIQNAYSGFAKQNYTMLDNLKLGYGGTKQEMERLLADAEELTGKEYDVSNFADIAEAIHAIQVEMGVAGTTALEGSDTISGSVGSISAAWQNLVTGFADPNADLGVLIGNVVDTGTTALDNLMPTIEQALVGIADGLVKIVPVISDRLPVLIETLLPSLIQAATTLFNGVLQALPEIFAAIIPILPGLINTIVDTIITMLPQLIDLGAQLLLALADGIIQNLPTLIPAVIDVILTIVEKLTDPDSLMMLIDASIQIIIAIAEGLINALPKLLAKAPIIIANLVLAIIEAVPKLLGAAREIMAAIVNGIVGLLGKVAETGAQIVTTIKDGFMEKVNAAKEWGKDLIDNFIGGIKQKWEDLKSAVTNIANTVKDFLGFSEPSDGPLHRFHTFAPDMMDLFAQGIKQNIGTVKDAMGTLAGAVAGDMQGEVVANATVSRTLAVSEPQTAPQMAMAGAMGGTITIPVYIGQKKIETLVVDALQASNYRAGGR